MKLAYFPGCKIPFHMKEYEVSFKAAVQALGVELTELDFNCCGYPARSENIEVSILSSIRNLALAGQQDLHIITPCKCCFGQFKHAVFWYQSNEMLKEKIDKLLIREGLEWNGRTQVKHLLSFLYHDIGIDRIKNKIRKDVSDMRLVVQYGCHALRPFSITNFDNPFEPVIFETLLAALGVSPIDWPRKKECCGSPVLENNRPLALKLVKDKFKTASELGANYICTACTHCQMHYRSADTDAFNIEPIPFTQLLCDAMDIPY